MGTTNTDTVKIIFEMDPCGRCGGTGRHQFNQRDGDVCWGCSGKGEHLSPRGKRAYEALDAALRESAGTATVPELAPGMVIKSKAHGGVNGATVWDYAPAWRRVESVTFTEHTGRGVEKGLIVDVPVTRAQITFEGGKTWTAESSDHPAYWARGAFHTIYTTRSFWLRSEEARAARNEVRRAIAARFVGAWLEGEEPPVRAERKPRAPKAVEGTQEAPAPAPKPLAVNVYPGDCHKCGVRVEAREGERLKLDGRWAVQHRDGECPERPAAEEPQQAPQAPQEAARPAMPNKFPGKCARCGVRVLEGAGVRVREDGEWITRHRDGECPADTTVKITEEGMYRLPGDGLLGGGVFRARRSERGNLYAERFVPPAVEDGGATFDYDPAALYLLEPSHRMSVEEAAEVGRRLHVCSQCGERLTDPKSVARGIGPVCAKKV